MSLGKTFKTNFEGEPPPGVFVQISLYQDGSVGYKFTEDTARWPKDGVALQRIMGTVSLIWWQLGDWVTRLMRFAASREDAMAELLKALPDPGEGKEN